MEKGNLLKTSCLALTICSLTLAAAGIGMTIFYAAANKIQYATIEMDGVKSDKLDATIQVEPGSSKSYTLELYSKYASSFIVSALFEGSSVTLTDYVTCTISSGKNSISSTLTEFFSKGFVDIAAFDLSPNNGTKFDVKYDFSTSITEKMIVPVDFYLSFKIAK